MVILGVLFDFDGTLTRPGALDFAAVRCALGCPPGRPILEFIEALPTAQERESALALLNDHEFQAAERSAPNRGAEQLIDSLRSRGLILGIISRNSMPSILRALEKFENTRAEHFHVILSRDDPYAPKPSPDGIVAAAGRMGVPVENLLVAGDFIFDIQAGAAAGAITAYVTNGEKNPETARLADFTVAGLEDLGRIVRSRIPLSAGKLPNDLLAEFLDRYRTPDDTVRLAPGVGEDVAAVDNPGGDYLVLKSDPITFASDSIGYYSVIVAANDIATCGARARYLLSTLLFPAGSTAEQVRKVMAELNAAAGENGMTVCGGHTEITDAVTRPVAVVQALGAVSRDRLVDKRGMKPGDWVLLTKGVAVEGTSILAREFAALFRSKGVSEETLERCRHFLTDPGISILREAQIAAESGAATAMHDVTEGGLATALEELSRAGGRRIRVFRDRIPVFPETQKLCRLVRLDPLGLIGSGSLLIACDGTKAQRLTEAIAGAGIQVAHIGEVLGAGSGVEARTRKDGPPDPWPKFEVDEITRLFALQA